MKNDKNIALYQKTYKEEWKKGTNKIKELLINYKNQYLIFNSAHINTVNEIGSYRNNLFCNENIFIDLRNLFIKEKANYKPEDHYIIIPQKLLPAFKELKGLKKGYDSKQFLIDFATLEAYEDLIDTYRDNYEHYDKKYQLNQFNEFEIARYNQTIDDTPLLKKLVKLKNDELEETNNQTIEKSFNVNFKIKEQYKETFIKNYNHFTDYFIDENKTSLEDFCDVFLLDPSEHSSKIYFFCSNQKAAYWLFSLQKNIFSKLSQTNIGKSKLFLSNNETPFSQSTISRSKNKTSLNEQLEIRKTIEFIKSTAP
ncbi:hypothetical protein A9Q87_04570 [Flavobacteriales bacterium 34_180_T64]|nr:hypothetical protein A9Q87_04570 [Flavobacteriales bacterium 34_180_T64]